MFFRQPPENGPASRQTWNRQAPWYRPPKPRYPYGGYREPGPETEPLPRTARRGTYSRWDEDRETTRYLSARTQLSIRYAAQVVRDVLNERFRALAPAYGVDVAAVTKWAIGSLRLRRRRNLSLCAILAVGLVALVSVVPMTRFWPIAMPAILVVTLIVAWIIVLAEYLDRYRCVRKHMLRGEFDPADAPDPVDSRHRERLEVVASRRSGNLVVFRARRPFVGSGYPVPKVGGPLVIDVSKGKKADGDKAEAAVQDDAAKRSLVPEPFTNEDVHGAIISAMDDLGLRDVFVDERLFVNGKHIQGDEDYLPVANEPPATSVNPALLRTAAQHPTPDARVYVCVEMRGWQGQLVVTLFARAVHLGGSLYIEWSFYVLPPVDPTFQAIDRDYDDLEFRWLWHAVLRCARRTPRELFAAALMLSKARRVRASARKNIARQRHAIEKGQIFDYGANRSIREHACGWQRQHYFLEQDEVMFILVAQEKLTRAVSGFLASKNVDLGQLEPQIKIINDNAQHFYDVRMGDVSNSSIAMGKLSQSRGGDAKKDSQKADD